MPAKHDTENRCTHSSATGRRCRLPRAEGDASLCPYHARRAFQDQQRNKPDKAFAADLLGPIQGFRSAAAINLALGKLFMLSACDRIAPRQAATLAYICQLLLNSLPLVKKEAWESVGPPEMKIDEILACGVQILPRRYR